MTLLPHNNIRTRKIMAENLPKWVYDIALKEHERCVKAPSWNPKLVHLRNDLYIVDTCAKSHWKYGAGLGHIDVALVRDHPFLGVLNGMKHVPRSVKSIYRKEVRVKHLRATEFWDMAADTDTAEYMWRKYLIDFMGYDLKPYVATIGPMAKKKEHMK